MPSVAKKHIFTDVGFDVVHKLCIYFTLQVGKSDDKFSQHFYCVREETGD